MASRIEARELFKIVNKHQNTQTIIKAKSGKHANSTTAQGEEVWIYHTHKCILRLKIISETQKNIINLLMQHEKKVTDIAIIIITICLSSICASLQNCTCTWIFSLLSPLILAYICSHFSKVATLKVCWTVDVCSVSTDVQTTVTEWL